MRTFIFISLVASLFAVETLAALATKDYTLTVGKHGKEANLRPEGNEIRAIAKFDKHFNKKNHLPSFKIKHNPHGFYDVKNKDNDKMSQLVINFDPAYQSYTVQAGEKKCNCEASQGSTPDLQVTIECTTGTAKASITNDGKNFKIYDNAKNSNYSPQVEFLFQSLAVIKMQQVSYSPQYQNHKPSSLLNLNGVAFMAGAMAGAF